MNTLNMKSCIEGELLPLSEHLQVSVKRRHNHRVTRNHVSCININPCPENFILQTFLQAESTAKVRVVWRISSNFSMKQSNELQCNVLIRCFESPIEDVANVGKGNALLVTNFCIPPLSVLNLRSQLLLEHLLTEW
ncbi:hypothetical protein AVEN_232203-1 [Araneus ventricosus]|uniref:Uncharacterized protein n=1 Tax=Araneus ventricosus TaxID=182803 RepID=A0A4Y2TE35_ARAVE|nr:hypothetical protein AVEN_232203-1 [Araneus ventricosus]